MHEFAVLLAAFAAHGGLEMGVVVEWWVFGEPSMAWFRVGGGGQSGCRPF